MRLKNAIEDVREVISTPFELVVASPLSLKLLVCYSEFYLCGANPRTCTNSQRNYYQQLIKNGLEMAEKYEAAKTRTCKPAWKGLKYIPTTARHWNSELITDDEAISLLKKGILKEIDFEVLPEVEGEKTDFTDGEINCIVEIASQLKEGVTKTAIKARYKDVKEISGKPLTGKLLNDLIKEAEKTL